MNLVALFVDNIIYLVLIEMIFARTVTENSGNSHSGNEDEGVKIIINNRVKTNHKKA